MDATRRGPAPITPSPPKTATADDRYHGTGCEPVDVVLRGLNCQRRLILRGLAAARGNNADRLLDDLNLVDSRIERVLDERGAEPFA